MITHFAELTLRTVSIQGAKQVYANRLGLPVADESGNHVVFRLTPHCTLRFEERYDPIAPAHFAIQVGYPTFYESVAFLRSAGVLITPYDDGREVDEENGRRNVYFRDGDGHIAELIAHNYVAEGVVQIDHPLRPLYLREVGFPVVSVPAFRDWLKAALGMWTFQDQDTFNFVIGGTAHAVVVSRERPWLPIAAKALPPNMAVTFGTPDHSFLSAVRERLESSGELVATSAGEIRFERDGYELALRHTPEFAADVPARLRLPGAAQRLRTTPVDPSAT